jgi:hypothetical protein
MPNYNNGKIYKLYNKVNDNFYIGSTFDELNRHKGQFNKNIKKSKKITSRISEEIIKIGWKDNDDKFNWSIEIVEAYPCKSKFELDKRELYWKNKFIQEHPENVLNNININNSFEQKVEEDFIVSEDLFISDKQEELDFVIEEEEEKNVSKYTNGKVYKLYNKINDKFYIGSTCDTLDRRKSKYNCDAKRKPNSKLSKEINSIGWKDDQNRCNWLIELLEAFPCNSKTELETREGYYQRKFIESHPEQILNQRNEGNEPGEVQKRASKKYTITHSEKIKEQKSKYREKKGDEMNARKREHINCDICGAEVTRNGMIDHKRSIKCQKVQLEKGLVEEVKEDLISKHMNPEAQKAYDRERYLKKKANGDYERKKTGPRVYQTCDWILQRATKDGKKIGDICEKPCIANNGLCYCTMHVRIFQNNQKEKV